MRCTVSDELARRRYELPLKLQAPFQEAFPLSTDINEYEIAWIQRELDRYNQQFNDDVNLTVDFIRRVRAGWKGYCGMKSLRFGVQTKRGTTTVTGRCLREFRSQKDFYMRHPESFGRK